jgi:hypothetical protein
VRIGAIINTYTKQKEQEMDLATACNIVQAKAYANDTGILEQLVDMKTNSQDYTLEELKAYFIFMDAGYRMFAPKETA